MMGLQGSKTAIMQSILVLSDCCVMKQIYTRSQLKLQTHFILQPEIGS